MKLVVTILSLLTISTTAFATVGIEDTSQMRECIEKAENRLWQAAGSLDMGIRVNHLGGMTVLAKRQYKNGKVVYVLGGGALAALNKDGYISGSGATTLVALNKKSCDILGMEIVTGNAISRNIDLNSEFTTSEP